MCLIIWLLTSYGFLVFGWFGLKETLDSLTKRSPLLINYSTKLNFNLSGGWKRIVLSLFSLIIFGGWTLYLVWASICNRGLGTWPLFVLYPMIFWCNLILFKLVFWHFLCRFSWLLVIYSILFSSKKKY
jgi:hypothetical protein